MHIVFVCILVAAHLHVRAFVLLRDLLVRYYLLISSFIRCVYADVMNGADIVPFGVPLMLCRLRQLSVQSV